MCSFATPRGLLPLPYMCRTSSRAVQDGVEVHRGFHTALQVVAEDLYKSVDSLIEVRHVV